MDENSGNVILKGSWELDQEFYIKIRCIVSGMKTCLFITDSSPK